jgi:hypothetical protein
MGNGGTNMYMLKDLFMSGFRQNAENATVNNTFQLKENGNFGNDK